jgi:predicted ATPase
MGTTVQGYVLALGGNASEAVHLITSGIAVRRSLGGTVWLPKGLSYLAKAQAELGQFDDAWRCIEEAITHIETTKERWWEAEVNRIAGEIALQATEPKAAKAEAYFDRSLSVARQQQARSWELRAAMSLARLWRDQGKVQQARELLAPVYGWFTEGFDTRDLKEAKGLLEELGVRTAPNRYALGSSIYGPDKSCSREISSVCRFTLLWPPISALQMLTQLRKAKLKQRSPAR